MSIAKRMYKYKCQSSFDLLGCICSVMSTSLIEECWMRWEPASTRSSRDGISPKLMPQGMRKSASQTLQLEACSACEGSLAESNKVRSSINYIRLRSHWKKLASKVFLHQTPSAVSPRSLSMKPNHLSQLRYVQHLTAWRVKL